MSFKRRVLSGLTKPELLEVGRAFELDVAARLSVEELRDVIAGSKRAKLDQILPLLGRNTLKACCEAVGLSSAGRELTVLVDRLLAAAQGNNGREQPKTAELPMQINTSVAPPHAAQPLPRGSNVSADKRDIEQYEHSAKTRANNPPVGLVTPQTDKDAGRKQYAYDPHLDPRLDWAGRKEHTSFAVQTVSLHVHERIDPLTIMSALKKKQGSSAKQMSLFEKPTEKLPLRHEVEFYKHRHNWSNRLIAGDSLLVMNSLIEKEGLAGQVQMVYLDPPYGIEYGSNFQPFVNRREVKDGADTDLTQEPETIRAFRDTWEIGIHSYLTYLRDRLLLAKELLHETGSCFVQISDENLHLIRGLMDEVFGAKNFIVTFPVKKKGSQKSSLIDPVNDYLVWYSRSPRESGKVKFRPLFVKRELDAETLAEFRMVELPDGSEFPISAAPSGKGEERDYRVTPKQLFKDFPGARLFRANPLLSGGERTNQSLPFKYKSKTYSPGAGRCWKTTVTAPDGGIAGMDRLAAAQRFVTGDAQLHFKRYLDDFGYVQLSNWWDGLGGASNPIYVVQTNTEIVQRCMLMTTDPGDLVLDPTCGSGTTAYVAEQWGRRWITTDTSRVSVALARQRLMTAIFDFYELQHPKEGIDAGFKYKKVPHVTLGSIANNPEIKPGIKKVQADAAIAKYAEQETLFDQPETDDSKVRVTGPFTVEAVPAPVVKALSEDVEAPTADAEPKITADASVARSGETLRQAEWRDELLKAGIRGKGGQHIKFARIEPLPGTRWLHADGETVGDAAKAVRVAVCFGQAHAPLEQRQVSLALEEASNLFPKPGIVVFAAFQFDPEAAKDIDEINPETVGMQLLKVQMNTDLLTEDLKKKRSSNESFWLVGQPDVRLKKLKSGECKVEVLGFDYFNTKTGIVESGGQDNIALWMLDPDYDGRSLFPRQVFFPMASAKDGWARLAKNLKAEVDLERVEAFRGTESLPFQPGDHGRAAVKIVDDRGIESLKIIALN